MILYLIQIKQNDNIIMPKHPISIVTLSHLNSHILLS